MPELIAMDISDFVPEEYELPLTISGHFYRFQWGEAAVDEVLRMILNPKEEDQIKNQRHTATTFLLNHLVEGEKEQFAIDMAKVPYQSKRNGLSVMALMDAINGRVKKKESGESPAKEGPSGSLETSHS
jgi:hypothetical protein